MLVTEISHSRLQDLLLEDAVDEVKEKLEATRELKEEAAQNDLDNIEADAVESKREAAATIQFDQYNAECDLCKASCHLLIEIKGLERCSTCGEEQHPGTHLWKCLKCKTCYCVENCKVFEKPFASEFPVDPEKTLAESDVVWYNFSTGEEARYQVPYEDMPKWEGYEKRGMPKLTETGHVLGVVTENKKQYLYSATHSKANFDDFVEVKFHRMDLSSFQWDTKYEVQVHIPSDSLDPDEDFFHSRIGGVFPSINLFGPDALFEEVGTGKNARTCDKLSDNHLTSPPSSREAHGHQQSEDCA